MLSLSFLLPLLLCIHLMWTHSSCVNLHVGDARKQCLLLFWMPARMMATDLVKMHPPPQNALPRSKKTVNWRQQC